jgi:hypothetical protein
MQVQIIKTKNSMSFLHHISLPQPDPLGGGLREEIAEEQQEPEAEGFISDIDGDNLADSWSHIVNDLHQDPDWFDNNQDQ